MSIQSQIDRINNAKSSLKSAITSKGVSVPESANIEDLPALVRSIPQEGGSSGGSGIIDVTELPTSNIDENAVYRVTETIQTEKNDIYAFDGASVFTIQEAVASAGVPTVPNIYAVDVLPSDMLESDLQTFSALHFYILKSDGIAYLNAPAYGGIITAGLVLFQYPGCDKGFTDNIYTETEYGVYTRLETFKDVVRYFIRKNSEWKEITTYTETTKQNGLTNIDILSGDITDKVFSVVDVVSGDLEELDESWFIRRDGTFVETIKEYQFAFADLKRATIPHFISYVGYRAFNDNPDLTVVTFEGKPNSDGVSLSAFDSCNNLTTINVPWSEGEVQNAPWGAINATINYNYTEG